MPSIGNSTDNGGARRPAEPLPCGSPGGLAPPFSPGGLAPPDGLPVRRKLPHGPPPFPLTGPVVQFVTINAETRGGVPFLPVAEALLDSARFYHDCGRWLLHLFLVMPDHLHMLASFPNGDAKGTCGAWKGYLRKKLGLHFQSDCFEHRIRNASEYAEKWHYIRNNPVRKGLVATAEEWPHWTAFDPQTGMRGGANPPGEPPGQVVRCGSAGRLAPPSGASGGANPPGEPPGQVVRCGSAGRLAPPSLSTTNGLRR